jgi:hypothetical protein
MGPKYFNYSLPALSQDMLLSSNWRPAQCDIPCISQLSILLKTVSYSTTASVARVVSKEPTNFLSIEAAFQQLYFSTNLRREPNIYAYEVTP